MIWFEEMEDDFMQFSDKPKRVTVHVDARGIGEDAHMRVLYSGDYNMQACMDFSLAEAGEFHSFFLKAFEDLKRRASINSQTKDE